MLEEGCPAGVSPVVGEMAGGGGSRAPPPDTCIFSGAPPTAVLTRARLVLAPFAACTQATTEVLHSKIAVSTDTCPAT